MFLNYNLDLDIDWNGPKSHLFLNPAFPKKDAEKIETIVKQIDDKNHIFLTTSGSSSLDSKYKLVALHKNAFLNSSESVNQIFQINQNDILLNLLPTFHVGGLSLFSRSFCAKSKLINIWNQNFKWDPIEFVNICNHTKATVTSLVPTQIFDLIMSTVVPPASLRCVFVGGGMLSSHIFLKAKKIGWPLCPTYGMTECCSQIATHSFNDTETTYSNYDPATSNDHIILRVLPHLSVSIDSDKCICVSGNSLLSYYIHIDENQFEVHDPKINNIFKTQDIGILADNILNILGRKDDNIKINGELLNLNLVNQQFKQYMHDNNLFLENIVIDLPNERTGSELIAIFLKSDFLHQDFIKTKQKLYNAEFVSHERIHKIIFIDEFPKTPLGKLKINKLKNLVQNMIV